MKHLRFLSTPYLTVAAFLLLLISGEHWGGFYLLYLLMALPFGGTHALLGTAGVLCLILVHRMLTWERHGAIKLVGFFTGIGLMAASLFVFFSYDKGYNNATFEQAVPIATFILGGLVAFTFLLLNFLQYYTHHTNKPLSA